MKRSTCFLQSLRSIVLLPTAVCTAALYLSGCGGGEGGGDAGPSLPGEQVGKFWVVNTLTDEADRAVAKKNAENTLVKYPEVDGMVGLWAYNVPMCLEALKDAGKVGEIKLFSFDEDEVSLQGIVDGSVEGTVVQQPYEFGYQSIKYLNLIADGKDGEIPVPENKLIDVPVKTITAENVEAHWTNLKNLRALGDEAAKAPKTPTEKRFAFITNVVDPFWSYAAAGCAKAEADFGVSVDFQSPPNGKVDEQNKILENVAAGEYTGVAISVLDPKNQTQLINETAGKMPLICHDSDAPESDRRFYLGTNNFEAGKRLGELIKSRMPEGGTLMIYVGKIDQLNAQQRRDGVLASLRGE